MNYPLAHGNVTLISVLLMLIQLEVVQVCVWSQKWFDR